MREYELMFIVAQRDIKEGTHEAMIEQVRSLTEKNGGRVLRVRPWGLRQLAYPIGGFDYGYYVIMQLLLDEEKARDFDSKLKTVEKVLRFIMLTKVDREETDVAVFEEMADEAALDEVIHHVGKEDKTSASGAAPAPPAKSTAKSTAKVK
jgi:small subunit ribosomal protein S6